MSEERRARFEALVEVVAEPLHRYALRRTDPDTAQDVLAESLLVLWRRLEEVPPDAALPWCYTVARHCLANEERSARRRRGLVARLAQVASPRYVEVPDLPDPEVHRALATLRPADRELLMLWAWEDLSPAEIARTLDVTPNAVHVRLHRARRRLADALGHPGRGRDGGPEGGSHGGKPRPVAGHREVKEGRRP